MIKGFRCNNCGLDGVGEVAVCPDCGSDDIDMGEYTLDDDDTPND